MSDNSGFYRYDDEGNPVFREDDLSVHVNEDMRDLGLSTKVHGRPKLPICKGDGPCKTQGRRFSRDLSSVQKAQRHG